MKKISFFILIAAVLFVGMSFRSLSLAEEAVQNPPMEHQGMMMKDSQGDMPSQHKMMGKEKMMGKHEMGAMMMKGMMQKSMVATSDGGVVVLSGNTLTKYDKNLNVVKEIELKCPMEKMHKKMMEMGKDCPMMKGKMMGAGEAAEGSRGKPGQPMPEDK